VTRVLIAGIGNIFLGDDAFGVEVVRALADSSWPDEVEVKDFGIRGYDLACALGDGYDAVILVDATPRGQAPGTVYLIEPDLPTQNLVGTDSTPSHSTASRLTASQRAVNSGEDVLDGHSLDPVRALQMAQALGGVAPRGLYLVGCEPGELGPAEGGISLSEPVQAAVPQAIELIENLVRQLLSREQSIGTDAAPAAKGI
jgi:hydrogenase maturation protease